MLKFTCKFIDISRKFVSGKYSGFPSRMTDKETRNIMIWGKSCLVDFLTVE